MLNFALMGLAIVLLFYEPPWMKSIPLVDKQLGLLRGLAVTALVGIPLLVLNRNRRESAIRGDSVRVGEEQFPEIFAILRDHCRRLGLDALPELFITGTRIQPMSQTFSSWRETYIVLNQNMFFTDYRQTLDVVSFLIAHELGTVRLGHTAVWNEMLLTYISAIGWLRSPLERARIFSRDRYGAKLSPSGFRGLLIDAVGRRLLDDVNIDEYFAQMRVYGGFWARLNVFFEPRPQVYTRLLKLRDAGYKYVPFR